MPLFGRKSRSPQLLTAVISATQQDWQVFWIGEAGKSRADSAPPA